MIKVKGEDETKRGLQKGQLEFKKEGRILYGVVMVPSPGERAGEIDALVQRIDFDGGLRRRGESTLGTLALGSQSSQCALVAYDTKIIFSHLPQIT